MFKLSRKKLILRFSVMGVAILAMTGCAGTLIAQQAKEKADAAGATAYLGYDSIIYFTPTPSETSYNFTRNFKISSDGKESNGYCLNTNADPPSIGEHATQMITNYNDNDEEGKKNKQARLLMYINEGNTVAARYAKGVLFEGSTLDTRGLTHAVLSKLYTGVAHSQARGYHYDESDGVVENEAGYRLTMITNWLNGNYGNRNAAKIQKVINEASRCSYYKIEGGDNQDIAWIEIPEITYSVGTQAVDAADNDNYVEVNKETHIKDTVSFSGWPNTEYTFKGKIKIKGANDFLKTITGNGTTDGNGKGRIEMIFDFPSGLPESYKGKELIIYEYMYDTFDTDNDIASHANDNDVKQTIYVSFLSTDAKAGNGSANGKYIDISKKASIQDTVSFCGKSNTEYKLSTEIKKIVNGRAVSFEHNFPIKTFTTEANGCRDVLITDSENEVGNWGLEAGYTYVFYEVVRDKDNKIVASHQIPTDTAQSFYTISLGTTAVDGTGGAQADKDKFIDANGIVTIKDTVNYCGKAGSKYIIKGVLMNKKTGAELLSLSGKQITAASEQFTIPSNASPACGHVDILFTFDAHGLGGTDVVVYETMYEITGTNEKELISHKQIKDANQTVTIINMGTTATDATATDGTGENPDGDHFIEAGKNVTITDTIKYCLKPENGHSYTISGRLMNAETGETIEAEGETSKSVKINPTAKNYCGSVSMDFNFDASELAGVSIVVFEDIKDEKGKIILKHEDPTDVNQTVDVISLGTKAVNKATGEKVLPLGEDVVIKDTISYCLKGGREYTLKGILINKKTGEPLTISDKTIESEITFDPAKQESDEEETSDGQTTPTNPDVTDEDDEEAETSKSCGTVEMTFSLNTTDLGGAELVVYESLYYDNKVILEHHDINDEDQTVTVELPTPETGLFTKSATMGSTESSNDYVVIIVVSLVAVGGYALVRFTARKNFLKR